MLKVVITIFYVFMTFVTLASCKNSTMRCQNGKDVLNNSLLHSDSKCYNCLLCEMGERKQFEYISCPTIDELHDCHQDLYLQFWRSEALKNFKFKFKPLEGKGDMSRKNMTIQSTTGKTTPLVPEGHIHITVAVGISFLFILTAILVTVLLYYVVNRKMKKEKRSNYDAIQSRIRQRRDDENYIRYTEDPTTSSSRHKKRVRASWPRAARAENRYLLGVVPGEPVSDSGSTNREDNPDSNSAQYVFIETFPSATAAATSIPLTSRTDETHIPIDRNGENS